MALTKLKVVLAAGVTVLGLVAVSASGSGASAKQTVNWATVTQLTASGPTSYSALVAAAKAEGTLNVITLPTNWANYWDDHDGLHKDVRDQDQLREPGRFQSGRAEHDQGRRRAFRRPGRSRRPTELRYRGGGGRRAGTLQGETWANIPTSQKDL